MDFETGFLMGGIVGMVGGWALGIAVEWVRMRIEERMPIDTDDSLDHIRRLS